MLAREQESSSARVESIDVGTGVQRWSSEWDAVDLIVTSASDDLYEAGTEASGTSGFIVRIDRLDGSRIWRTQSQAAGSGGGTCLAVATPYGIRASLRLDSGAEAHLTADARTIGGRVTAIAEVYAPYGFFEADLLDNRRSQPLGDRLFVDGFESL